LERTEDGAINGGENLCKVVLDDGPVVRRESYNREPPPGKVLLVEKALIAGNKNLKPALFCDRSSSPFFRSPHPMKAAVTISWFRSGSRLVLSLCGRL